MKYIVVFEHEDTKEFDNYGDALKFAEENGAIAVYARVGTMNRMIWYKE